MAVAAAVAAVDVVDVVGNNMQTTEASQISTARKVSSRTAIGLGYRPELALYIERREDLGFVEILAEDYHSPNCVPDALKALSKRGVEIIIHCTSLSLGGTEPVDSKMLKHLDALARYFDSPFVSDHVAFVRAGGLESGHLLPVPRNQVALDLLSRNVAQTKEQLSVPLVLENIATTFEWPASMQEMDEAEFLAELLRRTDCKFLFDVSNLFANSFNHKFDAVDYLKRLPLERLAYVHMAGGAFKQGLYHDTHCHPLRQQSLNLLASLCQLTVPPRVMLERDDSFPPAEELTAELDAIAAVCQGAKAELIEVSGIDRIGSSLVEIARAPGNEFADPEHLAQSGCLAQPDNLQHPDLASMESAQQALLRALMVDVTQEESNLPGMDPALLQQAHQSLIRKRLRTMRRSCPYLVELFGDDAALDQALRDFYKSMPSPSTAGPYIDAMHFVLYLHEHKDQYAAASKITKADLRTARAAIKSEPTKETSRLYRALRKVRLMR